MEITPQADENRRLLKRYLSQYYRATEKQGTLKRRLADLQAELRNPGISASTFTAQRRKKGKPSDGAAALTLKISEIENRIMQQLLTEAQSVGDIMDILDLLPPDSTEKEVLELRHIDSKSWTQIQRIAHLSRSPCFEYYNKGLDKLLAMDRVKIMLGNFKAKLSEQQEQQKK